MSSSSTSSIVSQCGAIVCARPPVAMKVAFSPSSSARRRSIPSTSPRSRRRSRTGSPPWCACRSRPPGEERSMRGSLAARAVRASSETSTPGPDHAAEVLAGSGDDVEVGRGAEVDGHAGALHLRVGGHRVDEPVGAQLVRVVDQDRHAGLDVGPTSRHGFPMCRSVSCSYSGPELGDDRRDDRPVQRPEARVPRAPAGRRSSPPARRRWRSGRWRGASRAPAPAHRRRPGASAYCRRRPRAASAGLSRPQ